MTVRLRIPVRYPVGADRLVLRTELDWERDLPPVSTGPEGAEFEVELERPSLALKPCLVRGGGLHWSVGPNYVRSAHDPDPTIWPAFFTSPVGEVSELVHVEADGRRHAFRVYTPPGYAENTLRRFDVLYMQDGHNLFFPEEAYAGQEWRVDETMDRLDQMNSIRKVIVVGVAPHAREEDYTAPGFHRYGEVLTRAIKATVDARWRTLPDPAHTVVSGSSLGGVVALHLAWQHPQVFGGAMCLSSTFGYRDDLFARVAATPRPPIRVYLDSGWPRDNFDVTNAMRDLLVARGFSLGRDLLAFSFPDGRHQEASWGERLHVPFQFFFGRAWRA